MELILCEDPKGTTEEWKNHAQYMSVLSHTANYFLAEGLIIEAEKNAIMSEGAESDCGK